MGLISKTIKEMPKFDLPFTVVELVSLADDGKTTIRIIDDCYSKKGIVVKTIELPSFDGEFAPLYNYYFSKYLELAMKVEKAVRSGRLY